MQQIIDAWQRILDPEFLFEDPPGILRPQTADPVGLGGTGQETFFEGPFLCRRQLAGPTWLSFGVDRFHTVIPIHVDPYLHEPSAAGQGLCDGWGTLAFQGQENGSIAVSLLGITLLVTLLTELREILRMMGFDLHLTGPPVSLRVCQNRRPGATLF